MASLQNDPSLTPVQRAYILGIQPDKLSFKLLLIAVAITSLYLFAAAANVGSALAPESVPKWAFNVGKFLSWTVLFTTFMEIVFRIVAVFILGFYMAIITDKKITTSEADKDKARVDIKGVLEGMIKSYQPSRFRGVFGYLTHASHLGVIAGLVMNGYVFLPLLLIVFTGISMFAKAVGKGMTKDAVQKLYPEITADSVIDITPSLSRSLSRDPWANINRS